MDFIPSLPGLAWHASNDNDSLRSRDACDFTSDDKFKDIEDDIIMPTTTHGHESICDDAQFTPAC